MRAARFFERHPVLWLSFALLVLNAAIAWPLFHLEYLAQTGSGESLTIAYARYARDHWPDIGWCRFWYGGLPFQNAYVPGLLLASSLVSWLGRMSAALAFHKVAALLYSMGPVTLFWMARRLSRSTGWSLCAALAYSLISPSAFLVGEIHKDLGSFFGDQRLHVMYVYGDNPHVSALTLLPLAILAMDWALEKRRAVDYVAGALALAAVPLTNWPGAIALASAVAAYALTRESYRQTWPRLAGMALLAYAMAMPWMPPSTIWATQASVQGFEPANRIGWQRLGEAAYLAAGTWAVLR